MVFVLACFVSFHLYLLSQGSLTDTCCNHLKHGFFNTKIQGNLHLHGNVQVYNGRIPECTVYFNNLFAVTVGVGNRILERQVTPIK